MKAELNLDSFARVFKEENFTKNEQKNYHRDVDVFKQVRAKANLSYNQVFKTNEKGQLKVQ